VAGWSRNRRLPRRYSPQGYYGRANVPAGRYNCRRSTKFSETIGKLDENVMGEFGWKGSTESVHRGQDRATDVRRLGTATRLRRIRQKTTRRLVLVDRPANGCAEQTDSPPPQFSASIRGAWQRNTPTRAPSLRRRPISFPRRLGDAACYCAASKGMLDLEGPAEIFLTPRTRLGGGPAAPILQPT